MKRTKLFYDSEFTGLYQKTSLISIAFVSDSNQTFYAEFTDYNHSACNQWIKDNVLSQSKWLHPEAVNKNSFIKTEKKNTLCLGNSIYIQKQLAKWLAQFNAIEIWADCLAYDWVLFCQLFGGAKKIPPQVFYMPFDLVTLLVSKNINPDIKREELAGLISDKQKHNALWDAKVLKSCYEKLMPE